MNQSVEDILSYEVSTLDARACVDDVADWIRAQPPTAECRWLACLNPHSYVLALADAPFAQALRSADWLVPDGAGIVLASRRLGGRIRQRVTGSDIFSGVQKTLNETGGCRVFFLGGNEETLATIRRRTAVEFPNIELVGTYSPPFKGEFSPADKQAMLDAVNAARPDVLWVGLSAPKQEKWLHEHQAALHVKFAAAVGAVFDFYSGRVKRSHPAFQSLGLEWLPRLAQQPRRLWRRMGVSAPIFLWYVLRAEIAKKKASLKLECR